jgi:glycosyltransferase involved in cell wall biosynthesis
VANNELENLKKLVPSILAQEYPDFELILVDDRSYDGTYDYFRIFAESEPRLKFLRVGEVIEAFNAKKFALTLAIKAAKNDYLLFTDADCIVPSSKWISFMVSSFFSPKTIILGVSPYLPNKTLLNKVIQFETGMTAINYLSYALAGVPYMGVGRNMGYQKRLFLDSKGFHPHNKLSGGDDDLFLQKVISPTNVAICLEKDTFVYSHPKTSWLDWFEQKKRHYSVSKFYSNNSKILLGLFHSSYLLSYILFFLLLFSQEFRLYSFIIFLVRLITFWILGTKLLNKLASKTEWYLFPLLEIFHCFTVVVLGVQGLKARKIKWK